MSETKTYESNAVVREATPEEWFTVADVTKLAYEQYAAEADPAFWAMYESGTRELLLNDKSIVRLVAIADGTVAATAVYVPPYERKIGERVIRNLYPEMRLLSVLPQFRNRKLGEQLITAYETRAEAEGYSAMTLHTTRLMTVAKAMYERRGYHRFEELDFEPVPGFVVWGYIKKFHEENAR